MRKGFSLIEMMTMLVLLIVISFLVTKPLKMVLADSPRTHRDFQANMSAGYMVKQLQVDIESGFGLAEYAGDERTGLRLLLIDSKDGMISYQFDDGEVVRSKAGPGESVSAEDLNEWVLPNVKIEWKVWKRGGKAYGVEVSTRIERKVSGHLKNKLQNSYVFFTGLMQKEAY